MQPAAPYRRTAPRSSDAPVLPPSLAQKFLYHPVSSSRYMYICTLSSRVPFCQDSKRRSWWAFFFFGRHGYQMVLKGRFTSCRRWEKSQCMETGPSQLDWTISSEPRGERILIDAYSPKTWRADNVNCIWCLQAHENDGRSPESYSNGSCGIRPYTPPRACLSLFSN